MEWCYDYDGVYPITRLELSAISAIKSGQCWDVFDLFWHLVFVLNSFLAVVPATSYRSLSSFSFLSFRVLHFGPFLHMVGDGPPSHEKEKQVCGFSSWLLPNRTRERVPPFNEIQRGLRVTVIYRDFIATLLHRFFIPTLLHRVSTIDQFDKFRFSRLSSSILQKDFLLETNWVRDLQSSNFWPVGDATFFVLVAARDEADGCDA